MSKVLIVDDDPDDIDFLVETINEIDSTATFVTVTGCEEALRQLSNEELWPDYIFFDISTSSV